jgi:hypothetical protein
MTQEAAEPQKPTQNFEQFESTRFPTYHQAHVFATLKFDELTGEKRDRDFNSDKYRVRIRRRAGQGKETFDVVSYRHLSLRKPAAKEAAPEPTPDQPAAPAEKPKMKAKERRAREKKTA